MKTKFLLAILTLVLLSMTVSAVNFIDVTKASEFTKTKTETFFEVKNLVNESLTLSTTQTSPVALEDDEGKTITLSAIALPAIIAPFATARINANIVVEDDFDFNDLDFGKYALSTLTITAKNASDEETGTATLSFVNGFCKYGSFGDLEITELKDKEVDNKDAWEWQPLDNVEFSVEIENNFDDDKRVTVKYEIYEDGKKVNFDNDDTDQSVSIDSGDSEKVTFSLRVPPDMDDGDYELFVKAYVKGHEDDEGCIDSSNEFSDTHFQRLSVSRDEDRAVIVDMDTLTPLDSVKCGDLVTLYAKIYNIGTEDEDKVSVNLYNNELGVDEDEVVNDLEEGESATLTFNFQVPENVEAKNYYFRMITFFEYDEDDDDYNSNSKDDLDETFSFNLKVACVKEKTISVLITAELESDATAGGQLTIKGTIKNTGEEETTYSLSVADYSSWAELDKITPSTVTLGAGGSKNFSITLDVNEEAEGEQFLTIEASYNGETTEQEVSIVVEGKAARAGITGATIGAHLRENWFIWVIIVINIILIIAIIIVARRIVTAR